MRWVGGGVGTIEHRTGVAGAGQDRTRSAEAAGRRRLPASSVPDRLLRLTDQEGRQGPPAQVRPRGDGPDDQGHRPGADQGRGRDDEATELVSLRGHRPLTERPEDHRAPGRRSGQAGRRGDGDDARGGGLRSVRDVRPDGGPSDQGHRPVGAAGGEPGRAGARPALGERTRGPQPELPVLVGETRQQRAARGLRAGDEGARAVPHPDQTALPRQLASATARRGHRHGEGPGPCPSDSSRTSGCR
jgi:hypothetical protein